jgi:cysteine desulfurase
MTPIYLDYNATTPLDPKVIDAMQPFLREHFGNPSSAHAYGRTAREGVERARAQVATLLGARPDEIVFTGGGSEASNLAIKGVLFKALEKSSAGDLHVVISTVEHPATLEPCAFLERLGVRVTRVPVDRAGLVDLQALSVALRQPTTLVSIMHAQNEVGTLEPIREIADLAHAQGALFHTDAAQSAGKLPVDVGELGVDLMTLAGHKLYAPKGVGALYVRQGLALEPLIHGAGHESGRRAGTENVTYLVALGAACDVAGRALPEAEPTLRRLRDRLWARLQTGLGDRVVLNGHPERRLPNTLNVSFLGHVGAELLAAVPEIAASTGSACHEGDVQLSPVLAAMNLPVDVARGSVRLSLGRFTTEAEVDRAAEALLRRSRS